MIRNVIFDIGNVLVDFCWREHIESCGFQGVTADRIGRAMMQSPVWSEIDRGVWSMEELLAAFIANDPEIGDAIRIVFRDFRTLVKERSGSVAWIRSLKAEGLGVYYLSNFSRRVETEAAAELSFLKEMDGGILSYKERLIKPDPAIYRLLLARYGLSAEESVFLDDTPENVEAAKALGMQGIVVESQEQAKRRLREVLRCV
ncbi:MAG: HAD family phosphatase [Lachnospiraceae bacterium]